MGYTASTYNITVKQLTQSGSGGFWWVEKDSNGKASKVGYEAMGSVDSTTDIFGASNYKNLMAKLVTESININDIDNPINVDKILVDNGIENQINNLDSTELAQIDTDFNTQILVKRWGNPLLAIAYFKISIYSYN